MKNSLIKIKTENAFKSFISSSVSEVQGRVFRFLETQEATAPCIFVMASEPQERTAGSGRYTVPVSAKVCCSATDLTDDPTQLTRIGGALETALTGSQNSINSAANNIFILYLTSPSSGEEITENTYQYSVNLKAVVMGQ